MRTKLLLLLSLVLCWANDAFSEAPPATYEEARVQAVNAAVRGAQLRFPSFKFSDSAKKDPTRCQLAGDRWNITV